MTPPSPHSHALSLAEISRRVGEREILKRISLAVGSGELIAIVGPDGAGQSTPLHAMAGLLPATEGVVTIDGRPIAHFTRKAIARQTALPPQQARIDFGFAVHDAVRMGRHPHLGRFSPPSAVDETVVQQAMEVTAPLRVHEGIGTKCAHGVGWGRALIAFS